MSANKDFFPHSFKNQRDWAANIVANAPTQLAGVEGWDAARIAAFVTRVTHIRDAAQAILDAQTVLEAKTGALYSTISTDLFEIRKDIGNMKKSRGFNDGKAAALGVVTPPGTVDPATIKPVLDVESRLGRNEIMAKKLGGRSLNVYVRLKGESPFRLLSSRRVRFPINDDTPPAIPGKPEEREYQAIALIGDVEVGEPSNIASAVFRP